MKIGRVLTILGVLALVAPAAFAAEDGGMVLEFAIIVHDPEKPGPEENIRASVITWPDRPFATAGTFRMLAGESVTMESELEVGGKRDGSKDRSRIELAGKYDVFFHMGELGVEIKGSFDSQIQIRIGETLTITSFTVPGEGPKRTRVDLIVKSNEIK